MYGPRVLTSPMPALLFQVALCSATAEQLARGEAEGRLDAARFEVHAWGVDETLPVAAALQPPQAHGGDGLAIVLPGAKIETAPGAAAKTEAGKTVSAKLESVETQDAPLLSAKAESVEQEHVPSLSAKAETVATETVPTVTAKSGNVEAKSSTSASVKTDSPEMQSAPSVSAKKEGVTEDVPSGSAKKEGAVTDDVPTVSAKPATSDKGDAGTQVPLQIGHPREGGAQHEVAEDVHGPAKLEPIAEDCESCDKGAKDVQAPADESVAPGTPAALLEAAARGGPSEDELLAEDAQLMGKEGERLEKMVKIGQAKHDLEEVSTDVPKQQAIMTQAEVKREVDIDKMKESEQAIKAAKAKEAALNGCGLVLAAWAAL